MSIQKKTAPPIKVWIWLGISYLTIQSIILFFYFEKPSIVQTSILNYKLNNLKSDFENDRDRTYQVVVIGTSLTGYGVKHTNKQLHNSLLSKKKIKITKIWFAGDPFKSLIKNTQLIEKLKLLKPDLICFQSEILTTNLNSRDNYILKKIKNISEINQQLIYDIKFKTNITDSLKLGFKNPVYIYNNLDTINHKLALKKIKKKSDLKYFFNGLSMLKKANIKMSIIDIPRPKKINDVFFSQTYNNNLKELLARYKKELDIDYWNYTGKTMYYKHFIDGGHLNNTGSNIYTKWLSNKIESSI